MNGYLRVSLATLAVLGLVACAETPARYYASSITAAQAAHRPVVVYEVGGHYSYMSSTRGAHPQVALYTNVSFINASQQPIRKLTFMVTGYRNAKPVLTQNGKPLEVPLTAAGPFPPGGSHEITVKTPDLSAVSRSSPLHPTAIICPHLSGIGGVYADGSAFSVATPEIDQYLTSGVRAGYAHCALGPVRMPNVARMGRPQFMYSPSAAYGAEPKPATARLPGADILGRG